MPQLLGVGFSNNLSSASLLRCSEAAEHHGLDLWFHEGYHNRGAMVLAAAAAVKTKKIPLGLGAISPFIRHPYLIAMDAGALDELSGGRLTLGLGASVSGARRQGLDVESQHPLRHMRDAVSLLRTLFAGGTAFSTVSYVAPKQGLKLGFSSRRNIPIFVAAMGPKMLELAGEIGDGVLLNYGCSPDYIRFASQHIQRGIRRRKLMGKPTVAAFVLTSVSESGRKAKEEAMKAIPGYLSRAYPVALEFLGMPKEQLDSILIPFRASEMGEAAAAVPDDLIGRMLVAGTPKECATQMEKFFDAGADHLIAEHLVGSDPLMMTELVGRKVSAALG